MVLLPPPPPPFYEWVEIHSNLPSHVFFHWAQSLYVSLTVASSRQQREYKKSLELEIKGRGMLALATDTPDFLRARNATDILSQVGITPEPLDYLR